MDEIVPRWEWRSFGDHLSAAERRFAELPLERVQESDELYLLPVAGGDTGGATVKIRDGLVDVKRLEQVDGDGLEQWVPVMKAAFPLPAAEVKEVFAGLRVPVPSLARGGYTLDRFVDEVVDSLDSLRAVRVHKRRDRYTIGGCASEVTAVRADGEETRTIAIESEDPAKVIASVRELGLESFPNVSYPRGLRALLGLGTQRYAVIDVGTNSVKFHLAERSVEGTWSTLIDRADVTRLGEGLQETGELGAEPMERTVSAIAGMADEARRSDAVEIAAVGTAGMRIARNAGSFVDAVRSRCGVTIEVISGEEEARLAYLAVRTALGPTEGSLVVFDTGGGSSQFTFGDGTHVDERFSVPVGAVRFTETFGLGGVVSPETLRAALEAIAADLTRLDGRPAPSALVAMGGAVTNLAAVKHGLATYDPDVVQGTVLDIAELDRQIERYRSRSADERRAVIGLQPKRAEVILAGACIVRTVMDKLGQGSLTVSDRGLRHGLLAERFAC